MELTSKQRSNLRSKASTLDAIMQIGKDGVKDSLIKSLSDALEKHELIKITVLETCETTAKETGVILAEGLSATFVAAIGRKVILYRRSKRQDVEHIEF